jgi:inosine-uridine nucleoside N-ribohydrolase
MPYQIIVDVDTGTDDAVALLLALCSPEIEVLGITTVNGNCPVEVCTENTLRVLDHLNLDVPVCEGLAQPLVRAAEGAHSGFFDLTPARSKKRAEHAVNWIVRTLMDSDREITLVALGPLTNVAMAIRQEPAILEKLSELLIMGGGHAVSNVTPSAEFNIWVDPEAARIVLNCGRPIRLVTLDATAQAQSSREDITRLRQSGSRAGALAAKLLDNYIPIDGTAPIYDALAMCSLFDPEVIQTRLVHIDVETQSELTRGRTVCDFREERPWVHRWGKANVHVAVDADGPRFTDHLHGILGLPL